MSTRDVNLKAIRTEISTLHINDSMSSEERFQNLVLRPVIKFQNELLISVFKNYIVKHKNVFYQLPIEKRLDYIENAIQRNTKFRNSVKGMIIGLFTAQEYNDYIKNSSALNKRMMNLVKQRLQDQVQLFDINETLNKVS